MINKSTTRRNYLRLLEYDQEQDQLGQLSRARGNQVRRKLTLNIDQSYHDVLTRICLIEGISKTEAVRRAINAYSEIFGDEVLFPGPTDF